MKSDMPDWAQKAKLLKSGLAWTRTVEHEVQDLLVEMIDSGDPVGIGEIKTPGGRMATVVVAVGDDVSKTLYKFAEDL